jgi:hypothetical protein
MSIGQLRILFFLRCHDTYGHYMYFASSVDGSLVERMACLFLTKQMWSPVHAAPPLREFEAYAIVNAVVLCTPFSALVPLLLLVYNTTNSMAYPA